MTIPGETILTGAPAECCGQRLELEVLRSAAGWYIGTRCPNCGPYSRESEYFYSEADANKAIILWRRGVCVSARGIGEVVIPEDIRMRDLGAATLPGFEEPGQWPAIE